MAVPILQISTKPWSEKLGNNTSYRPNGLQAAANGRHFQNSSEIHFWTISADSTPNNSLVTATIPGKIPKHLSANGLPKASPYLNGRTEAQSDSRSLNENVLRDSSVPSSIFDLPGT